MLMMMLATMTAPMFVQHEAQQKTAPPCAVRIFVVSKNVEPEKRAPQRELMPRDPKSKGPAVLQPGCISPEEKSTDYPMA